MGGLRTACPQGTGSCVTKTDAIVPLGAGGTMSVLNGQGSGTTHFILDVNGYFDQ